MTGVGPLPQLLGPQVVHVAPLNRIGPSGRRKRSPPARGLPPPRNPASGNYRTYWPAADTNCPFIAASTINCAIASPWGMAAASRAAYPRDGIGLGNPWLNRGESLVETEWLVASPISPLVPTATINSHGDSNPSVPSNFLNSNPISSHMSCLLLSSNPASISCRVPEDSSLQHRHSAPEAIRTGADTD